MILRVALGDMDHAFFDLIAVELAMDYERGIGPFQLVSGDLVTLFVGDCDRVTGNI